MGLEQKTMVSRLTKFRRFQEQMCVAWYRHPAAAAQRDTEKWAQYCQDEWGAYVHPGGAWGGVTSSKETLLAALQLCPRIRLPRAEAQGDILYVLTNEFQVGDVSVVHPGAARYRRAESATPGAAAAQRDTEKRVQYRQDEWGTYRFTPLSVESFGRLGTPRMRLLLDIGNLGVAHGDGLFTKEQLRHDKLVEVVRRAMRRGGVTSSKEPLLTALQPGTRIRLTCAEALGDILYVLTNELQVGDVSVVHPSAARYRRAAAATPGAAATQRDAEKRAQYRQDEWGAYHSCFTPLSVETFGRLGTPMLCLLSDIGNLAVLSSDGLFTKEQFVSGVLRELSMSLCKTDARLEHGVSGFFVRASGVCIRHGRSRPTAEVSDLD
jgi:hypothetical protein